MAKAPFWLRGGKGKLAGSVLFKGEKGTIVRENVTPHNPQSGGQMRQRVVWATVTQAAKMMLPIIGISFEGVGNEKLNRRKFVQLNSTYLSNLARNIQNTEQNTQGVAFSGKGNNQLIPCPYIVSRGSLQLPRAEYAPLVSGNSLVDPDFVVDVPFGTYNVIDLFTLIYGFKRGSQFTMPVITFNMEKWASEVTDSIGQKIDGIRYASFSAPRIVLLEESQQTITIDANTTATVIIDALKAAVDTSKTDMVFLDYFLTLENADVTQTKIEVECMPEYSSMFAIGDYRPGAVGAIYSELQDDASWKYTNSRMVSTLDGAYPATTYFGLTLKNAMASYRKSGNTDKNYLQTGGEGGNI